MEISIPDLKRKKEALMATFRQHLKKKKASVSSGCGYEDVYKPIWVFYDVMESFLGDVYECSNKMHTLTQRYEHTVVEPQTYETRKVLDEQEELARPANITTQEGLPTPSNKNVLKRRSSNPPELQEATRHMKSALGTINAVLSNKMNQGDDVCDLYGKLLASKLKKYFSDVEQQEVMCELDNVLIKRIRNRQTQSYISSPSTPRSVDSFSPASPLQIHRPSSSQTFYITSDSPVSMPQQPSSSPGYPMLNIPEPNSILTPNIIMLSPQHPHSTPSTTTATLPVQKSDIYSSTFTSKRQSGNRIKILHDEVVNAGQINPIREAFSKAVENDI
ncbi:unnamed protein product [Parnassius apollo]|uniref:(apollo) hypothetical protein n=1 Tax=Parnassius apollo TaxID=110799 RepID=A0A8S3X662_PARAO|nr:unnamed protein product [Parnassius apollo]